MTLLAAIKRLLQMEYFTSGASEETFRLLTWQQELSKWYTNTNCTIWSAGSDTPYGVWPIWTFHRRNRCWWNLFVPEGHQYSPPLFHGASATCNELHQWETCLEHIGFDVTSAPAISDGVMITLNAYDNQIYAYGMVQAKSLLQHLTLALQLPHR